MTVIAIHCNEVSGSISLVLSLDEVLYPTYKIKLVSQKSHPERGTPWTQPSLYDRSTCASVRFTTDPVTTEVS